VVFTLPQRGTNNTRRLSGRESAGILSSQTAYGTYLLGQERREAGAQTDGERDLSSCAKKEGADAEAKEEPSGASN
jgi:hypothetical protein